MSKDTLIDRRALFLALEDLRLARGLSWRQVAEQADIGSSASFTKLAAGNGLSDDNLFRVLRWLDADWREFVVIEDDPDLVDAAAAVERLDSTRA
jgi:transcriptional regulator with XRE-family HTH domain